MTAGSPLERGLITLGVILCAFMSALDTTVANIALPHIQGNLSASPEQITWAITSYFIAMAVTTPISGWLAARFGIKTLLVICVTGFVSTSVLCGLATNLPQLVISRFFQGMVAAPMMPLAQVVLFAINPPERYGRAMALFTMAAVVAPAIGPVFGGYLTENFSWRWCFYVNVPIGMVGVGLISAFLSDAPAEKRRFDVLGFGTLGVTIAALQLMLDRGTSLDWFDSREICIEAAVAGTGLFMFTVHTFTAKHPMLPPVILRDRNFVASITFGFMFSVLMFSSFAMLPLMMQGLLGYSVIETGYLSTPRGVLMLLLLLVMGRLDNQLDRRLLMGVGFAFISLAFWQMAHFDLTMTGRQIVCATMLQGIGQAMLFVPLSTLGLSTISQNLRPEASAFSILIRNLGGSVGLAAIQAMTVVNGSTTHASLAARFAPDDVMLRYLLPESLSPETTGGAMMLNAVISRQAMMVAYIYDFQLMAFLSALCALSVMVLRPPRSGANPTGAKSA